MSRVDGGSPSEILVAVILEDSGNTFRVSLEDPDGHHNVVALKKSLFPEDAKVDDIFQLLFFNEGPLIVKRPDPISSDELNKHLDQIRAELNDARGA